MFNFSNKIIHLGNKKITIFRMKNENKTHKKFISNVN